MKWGWRPRPRRSPSTGLPPSDVFRATARVCKRTLRSRPAYSAAVICRRKPQSYGGIDFDAGQLIRTKQRGQKHKEPGFRLAVPGLPRRKIGLLGLLLLLLADADLVHRGFGVLKRLVVVTRDRFFEVGLRIHTGGQDRHQSVGIIAGRAEGTKTLNIRNCHNKVRLTQLTRLLQHRP